MSRRLNRDPLPLHKPEACYQLRQWPVFTRGGYFHYVVPQAPLTSCLGNVMRWSLTYVATPIAVAVREGLFTCSGHSNSTN